MNVLRLLADEGIRPDTSLGQHFLIDENLVDVALRESGVGPDDVVLEVGAGPGVLTQALARRAATVHAVELDRRMEPLLARTIPPGTDVRLVWGDVMDIRWESLEPAPTLLVANLPYSIATPLVIDSLWRLPQLRGWCVMVQREVADRWNAPLGDRLYGAPSVLIALSTRLTFRRNVGRDVFAPPPRVDSALVAYTRTGPGASPELRSLVRAAFGQRRKTIVNALVGGGYTRDDAMAALVRAGINPGTRAQDITPEQFASMVDDS